MTEEIHPALVIVDMQNVFLKNETDLIPKVQDLAERWPEDRIYWLKYRNHPDSLFERHLDWSEGMVSPEIDLIDGKGQKQTFLHYGYAPPPECITHLNASGFNTAYICGVDTDACIYAAMMTFWDHGIRPVLLAGYCASSGGHRFHDAALALMNRQFGMESVIDGVPPIPSDG